MEISSFVVSVGTSSAIFVVLILLFTWLSRRPGNKVVYYPNRILRGMDPWQVGSLTRNPFSWIREALSSTERDVIATSGVDSAVYFVFLTTVLRILVLSGVVLLPVLLPAAATAKIVKSGIGTFNILEKLSMGHVKQRSSRFWAFIVATYWVSFVSYFLLWKAYKHVSDLRAAALTSSEVRDEQFVILVRNIPPLPKGQTRTEQVDSYFKTIYPDTFYRSMVVTNIKEVHKIYEELEGYKKKLAHAEAVFAESRKMGTPEGVRPTNRIGFLGLTGKKVDSIEYYSEKVRELIPKLEAEQKVTLHEKQAASALVFFTSRVTEASAAQSLHSRMVDTWTVMDAPEPRQIIWPSLSKGFHQRRKWKRVVCIVVALTIFFYMGLILLISAIAMRGVGDGAIKTVSKAYLPQISLIVLMALLPKFLLFLSKAEGIPSKSQAERAASGKYFYFTVLNVLIGVTVWGTFFKASKSIEAEYFDTFVSLLAESLPASATFFLTFVALKLCVGYGLELSRIVPLIIFHIKRKYDCKTEAELKEAWAPGDLEFATRVPGDLLIVTIVLSYSVIAPIIIPFGLLYFGLGWLVVRNQVLKVYVPSYESYGRMWPHINTRMVASLLLLQITMLGYFGLKLFYPAALTLIPLLILSLIFGFICRKKFHPFFQATALEVVSRELQETPNMELVFRSFIPPCLVCEDALSQLSRSTSLV